MRVLFFSPSYPPEMQQFTKALSRVGAQVYGVGDGPPAPAIQPYLSGYFAVPSLLKEDEAYRHCLQWLKGNKVDRIISNWEPTMLLAAQLREAVGLNGMSVHHTLGFRDKTIMRERVAAAGLRIPKTRRAQSNKQIWSAAEEIGFPLIIKPVAGAGSSNTHHVLDQKSLKEACSSLANTEVVSVEEYILGEERTHETICIDGLPVVESMSHYEPSCLVARQNEWISPIIQTYRHLDTPDLLKGKDLGKKVLKALGMKTGFTHMEWFYTPSGEAVFGEIACRSPGANMVDLMNYAGDVDLYMGWAMAVVFGKTPQYNANPYSAAIIFKRAIGQGKISKIIGLHPFLRRYQSHVARVDLLPVGVPRRNWKQTFLSDGNLVVRHPSHKVTSALAKEVACAIQMLAG
jgi:formate-dependent phosphoribosylglycinamide formyltransferase (GAR transformylase)